VARALGRLNALLAMDVSRTMEQQDLQP
jgi:hypothetical protein